MPKKVDLTGQRFGRLRILGESGRADNGAKVWRCICDCGKEHFATTGNLLSGSTQSCGCFHKECVARINYIHGKSNHRLHGIWRGMKKRCYDTNSPDYRKYGGRGIVLCEEWKNDFMPFYEWAIRHGYRPDLSIDRIDVDGNYEPNNCRWADDKIQGNNKRNNHYVTYNGKTLTITEWSELCGIHRKTITDRLDRLGWSVERALTIGEKLNDSR